jgi:hypothetical protein
MLCGAFANEILEGVPHSGLLERAELLLQRRLVSMARKEA